jgi:hypothetical protein
MEVITTHTNADFDTLASMVAAKKLYPRGHLVFPGSLEKGLRDAMETLELPFPIERVKDMDLESIIKDNRPERPRHSHIRPPPSRKRSHQGLGRRLRRVRLNYDDTHPLIEEKGH